MGYGREEDIEYQQEGLLSMHDQKIADHFQYDWSEWADLPSCERKDKTKIYNRAQKENQK